MPAAPSSFASVRIAFLVSAALLVVLSKAAAGQISGCVQGKVTDYMGVPLPEISVRLASTDSNRPTPEIVTDEQGRFEIADLEPGTYKAYAWNSSLGYARSDSTVFRREIPIVTVTRGSCIDLTLDAGAPIGHLMLNGRDSVSSEPLGSMVITLARPGAARSDTESDDVNAGQRDFEVPSRTDLDLEVSVTGYRELIFW